MLPKISIIIPCYNAVETICRTVKSIVDQQYPNLELILIDGGSKDGTIAAIEPYEKYFTKIISEPDRGQANALNKGFKLATGEIWGWLCADDDLTAGALFYFAKLFASHPEIDLITAGCKRIFADGTTFNTQPRPDVMERISYHNGIEQPSTLWRATLHQQAGELDESYNYAFDWVWWNQLQQAGAKALVIDRVVSRYYFSDTNKTSTGCRNLVDEMYRVIKQYGPIRGYLADIYLYLYQNFDLAGYYDKPPHTSHLDWCKYLFGQKPHNRFKILFWLGYLRVLTSIYGEPILAYNWNFASRQERNLCWYKYPDIEPIEVITVNQNRPQLELTNLVTQSASRPDRDPTVSRPRIAIDGCCFQQDLHSQKIWQLLLQSWSESNFAGQILTIDRERTAPRFDRLSYHELPSIDRHHPAREALLLQQICDREQIDIFLSTGDTVPIQTPSIALIADFSSTETQISKSWAIAHAAKCATINRQLAMELGRYFPDLDVDIIPPPPTLDPLYTPSPSAEIAEFRQRYNLDLPYLLLVDRLDAQDKAARLSFFQAFAECAARDRFAIVWINPISQLDPAIETLMEDRLLVSFQLPPAQIKLAYAGATALIVTSIEDRSTALEANACGCPVIVRDSQIRQLLEDAALYIDAFNVTELNAAIDRVQQPSVRSQLIERGFQQAQTFAEHGATQQWMQTIDRLSALVFDTYAQIQDRRIPRPNPIWQSFRELQLATHGYPDNLIAVEDKLLVAQQTIASMKSTKFWKMREQWFEFKQKFKPKKIGD